MTDATLIFRLDSLFQFAFAARTAMWWPPLPGRVIQWTPGIYFVPQKIRGPRKVLAPAVFLISVGFLSDRQGRLRILVEFYVVGIGTTFERLPARSTAASPAARGRRSPMKMSNRRLGWGGSCWNQLARTEQKTDSYISHTSAVFVRFCVVRRSSLSCVRLYDSEFGRQLVVARSPLEKATLLKCVFKSLNQVTGSNHVAGGAFCA